MAWKNYNPQPLLALSMMRESERDGTHKNGRPCNQCGQTMPGAWAIVERGAGYAPLAICMECAALNGDVEAIEALNRQIRMSLPEF
jgi:hypothetical protein